MEGASRVRGLPGSVVEVGPGMLHRLLHWQGFCIFGRLREWAWCCCSQTVAKFAVMCGRACWNAEHCIKQTRLHALPCLMHLT